MGKKQTRKSKDVQGVLFKDGTKPVETEDASIPQERHKIREKIESLDAGIPVIFHGDEKKIRDADLYSGAEELGEDADVDSYDPGQIWEIENKRYALRKTYAPVLRLAADADMVDYDPVLHKGKLKYVVVHDDDFPAFVENYRGEYGAAHECAFMRGSDFFMSLCQTNVEYFFRKNNRRARILPPGSMIHIGDYASKDEYYDDAADVDLVPLYDLPGKEDVFKYIVCKKQDADKYAGHFCECLTAREFEAVIEYTRWMTKANERSFLKSLEQKT